MLAFRCNASSTLSLAGEATTDSSETYTIAYTFDSDSLIEIRIDAYMIADTRAAELLTEIKNYFTEKYQDPITNNNLLWA